MKLSTLFPFLVLLLTFSCSSKSDNTDDNEEPNGDELYFPTIDSNTWETKSIDDLGWDEDKLQPLLDFLEEKNSKSFVILHNGKIVVEEYMNDHNDTKTWYWASAGKTLTSTITGIAQENNIININNKVSDYLGTGWTNATLEQENLITCKNLLSMTAGLDDTLGEGISSDELQYTADAGTRWAYHNVYAKLQDVVAEASNNTWSNYFNTNLKDKIGMSGIWKQTGDFSLYWSNTRSMARFGLLISANGKWENTQIIPEDFLKDATSKSQNINNAYGYFWWLNGKDNYRLPASQVEFDGELIPNAPDDMYAALGKNDQKIYIVPSKDLVIIRMGQAADEDTFALSDFDNDLWEKINALID